jgi:hypothetical protein
MTSPGWTVSTLKAVVERRRRNFCDMGRMQGQMVSQVIVWLFYSAEAFVLLVCSHILFPVGFLEISLILTLSVIYCI